MIRTISGNPTQILSLVNTVFASICIAEDDQGNIVPAFEYEEIGTGVTLIDEVSKQKKLL
jgi:hypothetical protein